ncbi:helix-turn-helix domain-containing protein [Nocardia jiangsuensis]|uniref:Helix-turn-helix domain-containing protein n=1 Tax=Nocardia jiangsuensis TaxID=1691563 RepID=A0ABV8E3M5_9NOCA
MIVERWTAVEVRALRVSALRDTQEQFAVRIGWKVPTVRKWERLTDS